MNEKKQPGIHIKEKILSISEIVAVDVVEGLHQNVYHSHGGAWELIFCSTGHMVVRIREDWIDIDAGCCLLIPPSVEHSSVTESNGTVCWFLAFATEDDLSPVAERVIRLTDCHLALFEALTPELTLGYLNTGKAENVHTLIPNAELAAGAEQLALNLLEMLLVLMLRSRTENGPLPAARTHVELANSFTTDYITDSVTAYIREHATEHLTVAAIAQHFGYSRTRLSTLYKSNTGNGLSEAISTEKLLLARHLLIESDLSVSEISAKLGFSSPQYFTYKFTKSAGMSPSNYARFKRTKVN